MQKLALTVSDKQLIKTFGVTLIAVVVGLPVASALMPSHQDALAHDTTNGVTKTVSDLGLGCEAPATTGGSVKKATSRHTHEVVTKHTNTTNNSTNNGGATAQVGNALVAVPVAVNDVVDVTVGDVSVPVLSNNNTQVNPSILNGNAVLSNNTGLLGLGLLGL